MRGIGIPPGQRPTKARGSFGIFEFAPDFRRLPRFRNNLLRNKAPVGVTGDVPVTLTVLKSARHRIALGYANRGGSRSRYAEIEFRPCPHKARTTWAGGLLLRDRQPVTLLVSMAGGEPARLRLGRPRRLIAAPSARRAVPPARYRSNQVVRIARIAAGQISLAR